MIDAAEMFRAAQGSAHRVWEDAAALVGLEDANALATGSPEQMEAAAMYVFQATALLEAMLKTTLPEPLCHNVRAALERFSDQVGKMLTGRDGAVILKPEFKSPPNPKE